MEFLMCIFALKNAIPESRGVSGGKDKNSREGKKLISLLLLSILVTKKKRWDKIVV